MRISMLAAICVPLMIVGCGSDRVSHQKTDTPLQITQANLLSKAQYYYMRSRSIKSSGDDTNLTRYKSRALPAHARMEDPNGCSIEISRPFKTQISKIRVTCPQSGFELALHDRLYVTLDRYAQGTLQERRRIGMDRFNDPGSDFPLSEGAAR